MGLKDIGATLPPGFRFYPSDEELVCHYLYKKIANEEALKGTLVEVDLHTCEPWQLPEVAKLNADEWYFFSFRDRKYATGFRTNRATVTGYWKATGKDRTVHDPVTREIVGMRKTLVFYRNRAPNGIKTGWIMHEFRLETPHIPPKEDWVLCRVFHRSKADNSNEMNHHHHHLHDHQSMQFQNAANTYPPSLKLPSLISPPLSTTPRVFCNNPNLVSSVSSGFDNMINNNNPTTTQPSLLHLLHCNSQDMINAKLDDACSFFWDANLEDGVLSNIEEMKFDGDSTMMIFQ